MKILSVRSVLVHIVTVETDKDNDFGSYTRFSADTWMVTMGESDEPVYDCAQIEKEFQDFIDDKCPPEAMAVINENFWDLVKSPGAK